MQKKTSTDLVTRSEMPERTLGLWDLMDESIAEILGVPTREYVRVIEKCSEALMTSIIFGALSMNPKTREQARRVFGTMRSANF